MTPGQVYLIPAPLDDEALHTILPGILEAIKACQVFFVENEKDTRRYFKKLWREMPIDAYEWTAIHNAEEEKKELFRQKLKEGKTIGIVSDAGCPGVADPGQKLVALAQEVGARVIPLTGPSSILLALMASGMNGQQFRFRGYLPIDQPERIRQIKNMENLSAREDCTEIFIETPYRNNQLLDLLLQTCQANTRICVAAELTSPRESVRTMRVSEWKKEKPDLHKKPVIFLLHGS